MISRAPKCRARAMATSCRWATPRAPPAPPAGPRRPSARRPGGRPAPRTAWRARASRATGWEPVSWAGIGVSKTCPRRANEGESRPMRVRFEKVTKRYGEPAALHEIDLDVEPGECLVLLG